MSKGYPPPPQQYSAEVELYSDAECTCVVRVIHVPFMYTAGFIGPREVAAVAVTRYLQEVEVSPVPFHSWKIRRLNVC